jgi:hypothetical protein
MQLRKTIQDYDKHNSRFSMIPWRADGRLQGDGCRGAREGKGVPEVLNKVPVIQAARFVALICVGDEHSHGESERTKNDERPLILS